MSANAALFAAQTGMSAIGAYAQYANTKATAGLQIRAIQDQLQALELRNNQSIRRIRRAGKSFRAKQKGSYIKSGVKLEGSALSVLGDSLNNEMEALLAQEAQTGETRKSLLLQKAEVQNAANNAEVTAFMQFLSGGLSATGGYYSRKQYMGA